MVLGMGSRYGSSMVLGMGSRYGSSMVLGMDPVWVLFISIYDSLCL